MKNLFKLLAIGTALVIALAGLAQAQTLPPVEPLPPYTKGDFQIVNWVPGSWVDSTGVSAFLLQWSSSSTFSPLLDAAKNIDLADTVVIRVPEDATGVLLPEDTIWYRVVAVKGPSTRVYSTARFSVQDATAPEVSSMDLLAGSEVIGPITNQTDFGAIFSLVEPAGLDTVGLYYRLGDTGPWNRLETWLTPAGYDFEYDLSGLIATNGDNLYEFAVGAIDQARPPGWPDSTGPGNALAPINPDIFTGVDTHLPTAAIDTSRLDSLYAVDSAVIYWSADDFQSPYFSGLDEITLHWSAFSGATGQPLESGVLPLGGGGGGAADLEGGTPFYFDYNNAFYIFRIEASDLAGNVYTSQPYDSVRVLTGLVAQLTLRDPLDPGDTSYVGTRAVGVTVVVNGAHVIDSLLLCTDLDPASINTCRQMDREPLPLNTTFTFPGDSTQELYLKAWVGGKLLEDHAEITVDPFPPTDVSIVLLSNSGSGSTVQMRFEGTERPFGELQSAIVWEEDQQHNPQILPLSSFDDVVTFRLSGDFDEKTIYARLEDRAENRSDLAEAVFLRIEKPHSYPNPFNPSDGESAQLVFLVEDNTDITIAFYDLLGNLVLERVVPAGTAGIKSGKDDPSFRWDGHNGRGEPVASGGYICVLEQNGAQIGTIKIAVVR